MDPQHAFQSSRFVTTSPARSTKTCRSAWSDRDMRCPFSVQVAKFTEITGILTCSAPALTLPAPGPASFECQSKSWSTSAARLLVGG